MAITSISRFLKPDTTKPPEAIQFIHFLQLLLQGVSLHARGEDTEKLTRFRLRIDGLSQALTDQSTSEEIHSGLTMSIQALQDYNEGAAAFMKAYVSEMQAMLGMMSGTIAFLASSSKTSVAQLQSIQQHLEIAAGIDDVKQFREQLSECLTAVQNESTRVQEASQDRIQLLQKRMERTTNKLAPPKQLNDPETGLRARGKAEEMIIRRILDKKEGAVALFFVDRLPYLTSRYGRKVADEVLLMVAANLTRKLPETSPPFRWSGCAFLVPIDAEAVPAVTERKVRHIAAERIEKHIEADGRSLMLPVSCSVIMQNISSGDCADSVFRELDKLVTAHGGEPA